MAKLSDSSSAYARHECNHAKPCTPAWLGWVERFPLVRAGARRALGAGVLLLTGASSREAVKTIRGPSATRLGRSAEHAWIFDAGRSFFLVRGVFGCTVAGWLSSSAREYIIRVLMLRAGGRKKNAEFTVVWRARGYVRRTSLRMSNFPGIYRTVRCANDAQICAEGAGIPSVVDRKS